MADFQTIAGEFAVRVNDGMSWCVYLIRAATERDAHVLAQRLWGQRTGYRVAHTEEAMPEPVNADAVDLEHHEDGPEVDWPAGEQEATLNIPSEPEPAPATSGSAKASNTASGSATSATAEGSSTSAAADTKSSTSATSGGSSTSSVATGSGSSTTPAGGGRTTSA